MDALNNRAAKIKYLQNLSQGMATINELMFTYPPFSDNEVDRLIAILRKIGPNHNKDLLLVRK